MRHLAINAAIAAVIATLVTGGLASAVARAQAENYAISSTPYLRMPLLEPVY